MRQHPTEFGVGVINTVYGSFQVLGHCHSLGYPTRDRLSAKILSRHRRTLVMSSRREVSVETQRTKVDWARKVAELLHTRYARATKVILVCDNLNTHTKGAFYEAFPPEQARAILRRLEFRYTPKHGSWLNIAENELSSLTRQCLKDRRLGDIDQLRAETTAWHQASNQKQRGVDWHFQLDDARRKLKNLYPKILV